MLFLVLFVAFMAFGWGLIWLHDTSSNPFWHRNVWPVVGVCAVLVGVFGTTISIGAMCGGVLQ